MLPALPDFPGGNILLAVLDVALAGGVTLHVLLRKRNVRAAVGWIGLAWLSPFIGAVLYFVLGINRVTRRATRLRRPHHARRGATDEQSPPVLDANIAVIADAVERLTGRGLARSRSLDILDSGDEAYPAMLKAIGDARRSIALAAYIFRADDAGRRFIDALAAATARGVEVRVLIDGVGGGYLFCPAARLLRRRGVRVERFLHSWLPWRMPYLNMRNHKKILVVDGAIGFTGGLNISDENVLAGKPRHPVRDVHFRVEGPLVRHLMESFADDWRFACGEWLRGETWWPELTTRSGVLARGISSGPDEAIRHLEAVLRTAIAAGRHRLRIVTPYFLPDESLTTAIEFAALRGVAVDIVVPQRSDVRLVDWAMRAHLAPLASTVRLYFAPQPFSHAKLMTLDGCWCLIGTANWDVRSLRLNFEFNLECCDQAIAADIDRIIDRRIADARHVTQRALDARPLPLRLRDAAARLLLPYL